jgi:hypothetical protein
VHDDEGSVGRTAAFQEHMQAMRPMRSFLFPPLMRVAAKFPVCSSLLPPPSVPHRCEEFVYIDIGIRCPTA